jgi:hypothetical protein
MGGVETSTYYVFIAKYCQPTGMYGIESDQIPCNSDQDMPITQFSFEIQQGKLMVKEYFGVMLLMAIILRLTAGSQLLHSKKNFPLM